MRAGQRAPRSWWWSVATARARLPVEVVGVVGVAAVVVATHVKVEVAVWPETHPRTCWPGPDEQ